MDSILPVGFTLLNSSQKKEKKKNMWEWPYVAHKA